VSALRAIVVGGGIGGLTTAIALARKGIPVTLLEQAAQLGEIGAGIQLSPNATRVLFAFGLERALGEVAFRPEAVEARTWRLGVLLSRVPLGAAVVAQFGVPYLHVHRADLIALLARAAAEHPLVELRLGTACTGCASDEHGATLTLATGESITADLVVGADGIRSTVRTALFGPEQPRFTGNVAWRGLVPARLLDGAGVRPVAALWMGPHAHFVHYFVRGGELVNFVGVVERSDWRDESWSARGDKRDLLQDFSGWHRTVQAIVAEADANACFRWALFDRDPLARWSRGAATLIGDACHPTLPFMAQGACMAIEDAAVLAEYVSTSAADALPEALARYETLRRPRTSGIQLGSRRNRELYHLRAPRSWVRNLRMRSGRGLGGQTAPLYGYDAFAAARG
jgi:2-polyprenyl-6-methoxyphenol hydroxylase-like FAD-dependent oxidoreductase